jgi:hypothetical protein
MGPDCIEAMRVTVGDLGNARGAELRESAARSGKTGRRGKSRYLVPADSEAIFGATQA